MTSIEQKIWDYLVEHKTPVQATTLAKRFIVSKGHVARILRDFENKNILDVVNIGRTKFYKVKD
jgi:uncharacterized membrane protein